MKQWQLRRATIQDSREFSACIQAAYSIYAEQIPDLPAVAEGIADDIATHRVWVAEASSKIVAGLVLIAKDDFLQLANIAVHPQYSGLGLGRALIERAEADAIDLGLHELRLSTHVDIAENVRLYTHLGWHETGRAGNKVLMKKAF